MNLPTPPILHFAAIDSTNAEARRRAEAGEAGPLWITADRQTEGRGRRGRSWETGAGNLAATFLTTTDRTPADAALISFVTALAVFDLVAKSVPESLVALKWPNDVMVAGRKVSGVLIESGRGPDGRLWLAVGCGVNLRTPPENADRPATAFAEHLRSEMSAPPSPAQALQSLAAAFQRWTAVWDAEGAAAILAGWRAKAQGFGAACTARLDRETVEGVAEGLDADGALRLRLPDGGIRRITAGDVFFPETPVRAQETG